MSRVSARLGLCLLALIGLLGCGDSGGPSVQYVEGLVTLDGAPIEGVSVSFSPVKPDAGTPAVGTTDAKGVFRLTAVQGGKPGGGTGVGEYQVTFSKIKAGGLSSVTSSTDPNYGKEDLTQRRQATQAEYIVPQKYGTAATSGFKVTVKPGTNKGDEFKFDLNKE